MLRAVSIGASASASLMRISTRNNAFGAPSLLRPINQKDYP
jgi:hypothetical protein